MSLIKLKLSKRNSVISKFTFHQVLPFYFLAFVPDHRCYISSCDNSTSQYEEDFLNFSVPWNEDDSKYREAWTSDKPKQKY